MTSRISIALATFNGKRFLRSQLRSLANQTRKPCELVVCDDGSTDQTLSILHEFARKAPFPVRIFENPTRLGYRKNFMRAAQECKGHLISFCDQDDIWAPGKLEVMERVFEDPSILLAFHNARLVTASGQPKGLIFRANKTERSYAPLDLQPWLIVPGFSQVFRRALLDFSPLHDHSLDIFCPTDHMPHDQWVIFLASILGHIKYVPDALVHYRQHDANTSGWLHASRLNYAVHNISYARYYAHAALAAADNRIELLGRLRDVAASADIGKVDVALAHHRHIRTYAERRMKLYTSKSMRVRTKSLISLVRNGAYTDRKARLGFDSLLLDICIGLPTGPSLRAN